MALLFCPDRDEPGFEELGVAAALINCVPPDHVSGMVSWLRDFTDVPLGVYPNLGHLAGDLWRFDEGTGPADYAELARGWRAEGRPVEVCLDFGPQSYVEGHALGNLLPDGLHALRALESLLRALQVAEILNRDQVIATLNSKGRLALDITVQRVRAYVSAGRNNTSATIGVIPVDSIYAPVRGGSFDVEATRVEQSTDYYRLVLEIETDGSISPADALASAGSTRVQGRGGDGRRRPIALG